MQSSNKNYISRLFVLGKQNSCDLINVQNCMQSGNCQGKLLCIKYSRSLSY